MTAHATATIAQAQAARQTLRERENELARLSGEVAQERRELLGRSPGQAAMAPCRSPGSAPPPTGSILTARPRRTADTCAPGADQRQ